MMDIFKKTLHDAEILFKKLSDNEKAKCLEYAAENNLDDYFSAFLPHADIAQNNFKAFCLAAGWGRIEILDTALPFVSDQDVLDYAFRIGASNGQLLVVEKLLPFVSNDIKALGLVDAGIREEFDVVRFLLPYGQTPQHYHQALLVAVSSCDVDMVTTLLPLTDPLFNQDQVLPRAAEIGNLAVLDAVLSSNPCMNTRAHNSQAFCLAVRGEHFDVAKRLYPLSDVDEVKKLMYLKDKHFCFIQKLEVVIQREFIEAGLGERGQTKDAEQTPPKKKM